MRLIKRIKMFIIKFEFEMGLMERLLSMNCGIGGWIRVKMMISLSSSKFIVV